MSINCNRNYIIHNLLDSPDQDMLVINLHFAFVCACFGGILQTFKKCQTLGQFFESLYMACILHILVHFHDYSLMCTWSDSHEIPTTCNVHMTKAHKNALFHM